MSTYHLHARRILGPLCSPVSDDRRAFEDDNYEQLTSLARRFCSEGFTVWIYDHGHPSPLAGASDLRTITRLSPRRDGATREPAG